MYPIGHENHCEVFVLVRNIKWLPYDVVISVEQSLGILKEVMSILELRTIL